jgi:hypothetical protein
MIKVAIAPLPNHSLNPSITHTKSFFKSINNPLYSSDRCIKKELKAEDN